MPTTIPDGTYTAVVDRIEDGLAALELEGDADRYELLVAPDELPADGRTADAVLEVTIVDSELADATFDAEATRTRKQRAQERFDRLSERPPQDDDGE